MTLSAFIVQLWLGSMVILQTVSTPIWVPLTIILLIILLFWWGLTRNRIPKETESDAEVLDIEETEPIINEQPNGLAEEVDRSAEIDEPTDTHEPDDLKLIDGIGPKIEVVLADAGITTFAQLANSDPDLLEKIVRDDAGIRLAKPSSWPEQASLAAAGDWEGLEILQGELSAGRHD